MFPLVLPNRLSTVEKVRRFIVPTQWLAIKNHRFLVGDLDRAEFPVHSYGSGQTYHKLLPKIREVYREDHHGDRVVVYNKESEHIHFGHTEYREMIKQMEKSWFSLDMSIQGMTNMTHWEPMTVGTISLIERRVIKDEFCEIPEDCCLSFDLDYVVDEINLIGRTPLSKLKKVQARVWKFIQRCDCQKVASQLLNRLRL
jgi:hypothetical protein